MMRTSKVSVAKFFSKIMCVHMDKEWGVEAVRIFATVQTTMPY